MKIECDLCGNNSEAVIQEMIIVKAIDENEAETAERAVCPYYSLAETNSFAYERFNGSDECFKNKNSCCNCMHRVYSLDYRDFYCFFDYLDKSNNEMYYLKPAHFMRRKRIVLRYWVCPICKARIEITKREVIMEGKL